jgi:hypothetical protein
VSSGFAWSIECRSEPAGDPQSLRQTQAGSSVRARDPAYGATMDDVIDEHTLRQRSYSVLIFLSFSRLAVMDSRTELVPLIHSPPSRRRV